MNSRFTDATNGPVSNRNLTRRQFLRFLGSLGAGAAGTVMGVGRGDDALAMAWLAGGKKGAFDPLPAMADDSLVTVPGINTDILVRYGDVINEAGERFGFNNDFIAFFPLIRGKVFPANSVEALEADEALLWVNHETPLGLLMHGNPGPLRGGLPKTAEQVREEQLAVGGSIIRIVRDPKDKRWRFGGKHPLNRRISALTEIPFAGGVSIAGGKVATGTFGNCAGGVTPWGTVLTCEENYREFYGDLDVSYEFKPGADWRKQVKLPEWEHSWTPHAFHHPWHYGWVVEIDPLTGRGRKLVAMGRADRECATVTTARDGRAVVYSGDDYRGGCIFKFISKKPGDLSEGDLYAADVERGRWILLSWEKNPVLRKNFRDQTHVLLNARAAGLAAGATAMDRPEDVEIHPLTGAVFIALTNNPDHGNNHGALFKIEESGGDPLALEFTSSTWIAGGKENGFSCPDNLVFDRAGNLYFTTDISKDKLNKGPYQGLGNNGLFVVPVGGPDAGKALRLASAPVEAEFTGPCFSPDEKTLFLSVQHPGEHTQYVDGKPRYSSSWPHDGSGNREPGKPCPAVVALQNLPLVSPAPQS